jgi:hypothetical protein
VKPKPQEAIMKDLRCTLRWHKWKKVHNEGGVYLKCVRCGAEEQPNAYTGAFGGGF